MKKILIISGLLISQFQGLAQILQYNTYPLLAKDTSDSHGFFQDNIYNYFACSYKDHISGTTYEIPYASELWCFPNYWKWFDTLYIHRMNPSNGKTNVYQVYHIDSIQGKYYINYNGEKLIFQENTPFELDIYRLDSLNKEQLIYTYYFLCELERSLEILNGKFFENGYGYNMYRVHHYTDNKTNKLYQCKKLEKVVYDPIVEYGSKFDNSIKDTTYLFIVDFQSGNIEVFKQIKRTYKSGILIDKNGVKKAIDFSEKRSEFGDKHCYITGRHLGILDLTSGRVPIFNSGKTYHLAISGHGYYPNYNIK